MKKKSDPGLVKVLKHFCDFLVSKIFFLQLVLNYRIIFKTLAIKGSKNSRITIFFYIKIRLLTFKI